MNPEPTPTPGWLQPVEAALADGDRAGALRALAEAAAARPHDEELPLLAAGLCLEDARPGPAAGHALAALAIRPFYPAAVDALGVACTDALDPRLAQEVLRRGVRMAPGLENLRRNLASARRTAKGLRRGAYDRDEARRLAASLPRKAIETWLATRPERISVALAVRDAGCDGLYECLESIAGSYDELLVADARRSREAPLVLPANATVVEVDPDGDEVAHELLRRQSRGDWILFLEADERLDGPLRDELATLEGEALAVALELTDLAADGGRRQVVRCVRNACSLHVRGRVLPRVGGRLAGQEAAWGLSTVDAHCKLLRKRGPRTDEAAELERLTARLDADLARDAGNQAARLERAWVHLDRGQPAEAYRLVHPLRRALDEQPATCRLQELEEPMTVEALCLLVTGQVEELCPLLAAFHERTEGSINTRRIEATALLAAGDPAGALRSLRFAADVPAGFVPVLPQLAAADLATDTGTALMERGANEEAGIAFGLALSADPGHLVARLGALALDFAGGDLETVLHELDRLAALHGDDRRVWLTGGIVLGQHAELAQVAVDWMSEGCRRLPGDAGLRRRLGELQLLAGNPTDALASLGELEDDSADVSAALAVARLAAADAGALPEVEVEDVDAILGWLGAWLDRQVWEPLDRALVRMPELGEGSPELIDRTARWLCERGQPEAAEKLAAGVPAGRNR